MNTKQEIWDHNFDKMTTFDDKIIDWKNPDGTTKKLNFDDDGNLIGTKSKEDTTKEDSNDLNWIYKRHRYYEDLNLNQYMWTTHKQSDGKFHIIFKKFVRGYRTYSGTYKVVKRRSFNKKKTAIAYCLKAYLKAKERQQKVLEGRAKRKQARLDLKPKGKEKSKIEAKEKLAHFTELSWNIVRQRKDLEKKHKKQLRSLGTRMINYNKKVKYYRKRVEQL